MQATSEKLQKAQDLVERQNKTLYTRDKDMANLQRDMIIRFDSLIPSKAVLVIIIIIIIIRIIIVMIVMIVIIIHSLHIDTPTLLILRKPILILFSQRLGAFSILHVHRRLLFSKTARLF